MKRLIWVALLMIAGNAQAQVQSAGTFDPKTGTVKVDINKTITIANRYEKAPITTSGILDKIKSQKLAIVDTLIYRFFVETDKPQTDEDGKPVAGKYLWRRIDCLSAELYFDKVLLLNRYGQKEEWKGKYRYYVIRRDEQ